MRSISLFLVTIAVLGCVNLSFADDMQHWNDDIIRAKINPRWEAEIYNRSRWRQAIFDETFQNCIQIGARYKFSKKFNILAAYRYDIQDKGSYYEFENRFLLNLSYSLPSFYEFSPKLSQRTELRYFTRGSEDHVRVRGRLDISRNFIALKHKFTPAVGYEIFWDDIAKEINRGRLYIGISSPINEMFAVRVTWIRQFDKNKDDLDILNTGFNMYF